VIWKIPVGRGHHVLGKAPSAVDLLLGGWQLSTTGTARTGLPLNVTISRPASALPDQINSGARTRFRPQLPQVRGAGITNAAAFNQCCTVCSAGYRGTPATQFGRSPVAEDYQFAVTALRKGCSTSQIADPGGTVGMVTNSFDRV
jgi:hypothetical protein